jgi:hypothetical protein
MTGAAQEQGQKATEGPSMTEKAQGKAAEMQHRAGGWWRLANGLGGGPRLRLDGVGRGGD